MYKTGEKGEVDEKWSCLWGLRVEKCGDRRNLLVCDRNNEHIQQFGVEGCFTGNEDLKLEKGPTDKAKEPDPGGSDQQNLGYKKLKNRKTDRTVRSCSFSVFQFT